MEVWVSLRSFVGPRTPSSSRASWFFAALLATAGFCAAAGSELGAVEEPPGAEPAQEAKAPAQEAKPEEKPPEGYFQWTDTSLTLLPYGIGYRVDPSKQSTLTLEHAHSSAIGDFFGFLDVTDFYHTRGPEMTWYAELGARLSAGKILKEDLSFALLPHSFFEVKDVLLAAQYERGEDPDVAEAVLAGVGLDLNIHEAGVLGLLGKFQYIQLNLYARAELTTGVEHGFEDMQITLVAGKPFEIGGARFLIDGYFDWILGLGSEQSSFHLNPQVKLDVGNFWGKPQKFYAGFELDFWWDKYQIPNSSALDTDQQAVSLLLKLHF